MKTAIILLSDPQSGDEALGRAFNALALARECREAGDEVAVEFVGAGTRWPAELSKLSHPANALFNAVRESIVGASCGCATVFGAKEGVQACGVALSTQHALPGTPGVTSIRRYLAEGWQTLVF
jgi:hypothetical protein